VLWSSCRALGNALKGSPIDALIRSCLLEERSADSSFSHESYTLKWAFHNELGLVFVAVYQRILHLLYVDDLLASVRGEFSAVYDPKRTVYDDFDETFRQLQNEAEARAEEMKKLKQSGRALPAQAKKGGSGQRAFTGSQGNGTMKGSGGAKKDDSDDDLGNGRLLSNGVDHGVKGANKSRVVSMGKENGTPEKRAFDVNKLKMRSKTGKKVDGDMKSGSTKREPKKAVKKNRVWDDSPVEESRLDFTDERGDEGIEGEVAVVRGESMMDKEELISSESEGGEEDEVEGAKPGTKKKGWFTSMFQR
jgi:signal recognition particle receptor subunit alpha